MALERGQAKDSGILIRAQFVQVSKAGAQLASGATVLADCYRNGLQSAGCGGKIVGGAIVIAIAKASPAAGKTLGKLSPIVTLISGGKAWWDINKELNKGKADQEQRDAQAKARDAQVKVNQNNRDAFYPRIEILRKQDHRASDAPRNDDQQHSNSARPAQYRQNRGCPS